MEQRAERREQKKEVEIGNAESGKKEKVRR